MSHNSHVKVYAVRTRAPGGPGRMRYVTFKLADAESFYNSTHLGPGHQKALLVNGKPARKEIGKPCHSQSSC